MAPHAAQARAPFEFTTHQCSRCLCGTNGPISSTSSTTSVILRKLLIPCAAACLVRPLSTLTRTPSHNHSAPVALDRLLACTFVFHATLAGGCPVSISDMSA